MERAELANWLRLLLTPGVGNEAARHLLRSFGLPESVFAQSSAALQRVVTPEQAQSLRTEPPELAEQLQTTWDWLQQDGNDPARGKGHGIGQGIGQRAIVVLGDPLYPQALLRLDDPPLLLYLLGQITALEHRLERSIAVVGSRNPTPQGATNANHFAKALQEAGYTVVSGLALGIDGAAHEGALAGALAGAQNSDERLATIAVVGTGLDRVYPRDHRALAHQIAQHGLLVSEYPLGTPPLAANFPRRNRLIAGLSCGTLVVEAALKSGSLITARLAAEQGKEVFAIPGSIHSIQSRGCHALIKEGAKLVETAQDVLEELQSSLPLPTPAHSLAPQPLAATPADKAEGRLLHALGFDPVGLDALVDRTGLDAANLQAQLMALELRGLVARLPGARFQRLAQA